MKRPTKDTFVPILNERLNAQYSPEQFATKYKYLVRSRSIAFNAQEAGRGGRFLRKHVPTVFNELYRKWLEEPDNELMAQYRQTVHLKSSLTKT